MGRTRWFCEWGKSKNLAPGSLGQVEGISDLCSAELLLEALP